MQKKKDPLDELVRRRLEDFEVEPPPGTRDALMEKISSAAGTGMSSRKLLLRIAAGLLLLGGALLGVLLLWPESKTNQMADAPSVLQTAPADLKSKEPASGVVKDNGKKQSLQKAPSPVYNPGTVAHGKMKKQPVILAMNTSKEEWQAVEKEEQFIATDRDQPVDHLMAESAPFLPDHFTGYPFDLDTVQKLSQEQLTEIIRSYKSHPPKSWNINLGAYYTPEVMFNTLGGEKFVNNTGIESTFRFGRYSVRTGVGVSVTSGSNELLIKTNPYLGTYEILDSVVFRWDEDHINLIPVYFTSGKEIYDTALHYTYYQLEKRYTYLQVPLVLGYDIWSNDKLAVGFRAGAVMSLLLKTKNLTQEYDPGLDRIVTVNYITPDRIALNWQALAGINASFRLSKKFSLELEPEFRYYFNSIYESSEITQKPWSVGLRAAILFNFVN